jgi:hypothetical protein
MPARRVFLIESLDAAGAGVADARAHLEALECAGCPGRAVAVERRTMREPRAEDSPAVRGRVPIIHERDQLLAAIASSHADFILLASSRAGGGTAARWLPPGMRARWWPTGISVADEGPEALGAGRAHELACVASGASGLGHDPGPFVGLEWSVVDGPRASRARLSLWDGDYVLVPTPLSGRAGEEAVRAFASVAEEWDSLDLVVLSHPQEEFALLARELGIATRVHFAGPAPREAEYAWYGAASAMLLGTQGAVSGGLVLRVLASGCPMLPLGHDDVSRTLRGWLEYHGLTATLPTELPGGSGLELGRTLERDARIEEAVERGRSFAAMHRVDLLGPRLAASLAAELDDHSQAA